MLQASALDHLDPPRYWQHHPSLAYLFTGHYVGPLIAGAAAGDESARELYDLEMAYQFLEKLGPGDHRYLISETLRHLHTDASGNTHRSEISFDKFWNTGWNGGCRGLVEFRAVESMPKAEWMSAVALLWQALAAMLFEPGFAKPLVEHGSRLHDHYFLPTLLWEDFAGVLGDLKKAGFDFEPEIFRAIWNWRFPSMLAFENAKAVAVSIRKAHTKAGRCSARRRWRGGARAGLWTPRSSAWSSSRTKNLRSRTASLCREGN